MDLFAPLRKALAEQNYTTPTPIQSRAIPPAIEGLDILGCAQTGTGKTAAFALPILDYLGHENPAVKPKRPIALVLAPTRELAVQIAESFEVYGRHVRFSQTLVYGGVSQHGQAKALRQGVDVLIATPGRLLDLMDQGHVDLSEIEIFVLDEADRMLDMGFLPALKRIIAKLPNQRQSLFFSATLPPKIRELADKLLFNPVSVTVAGRSVTVDQIEQSVRFVERGEKLDSLRALLGTEAVEQAIVFTRTKYGASGLAKKLERNGVRATAIHGNKSQNARLSALDAFRKKDVTVLVATDVAARGIDIEGVTHVVNYDMPVDPDSYVHRIGRTGRAGAVGVAVSFCTSDEVGELNAIEKLLGKGIRAENPDDRFESDEGSGKRRQGNRRQGPSRPRPTPNAKNHSHRKHRKASGNHRSTKAFQRKESKTG